MATIDHSANQAKQAHVHRWIHSLHFALAACVDRAELGMICEFQRLSREMLICLQEVQFHTSFLLCILENIPKETKLDAEKILGEEKNNTPNSDQFYFNGLICLPAGHRVDYL